jgi:hypothetical protein
MTFSAVSSSREDRSKPLRDGFLEMTQFPLVENGHLTVRDIQVANVVFPAPFGPAIATRIGRRSNSANPEFVNAPVTEAEAIRLSVPLSSPFGCAGNGLDARFPGLRGSPGGSPSRCADREPETGGRSSR